MLSTSNQPSIEPQGPFRRIALIGKHQDDSMGGHIQELADLLAKLGCEVYLEDSTASHYEIKGLSKLKIEQFSTEVDLAIVLGGDGTMLGIGRQLAGSHVPLVGINLGRLGYITDIPFNEIQHVLPDMIQGQYEADPRTLLQASITRKDQEIHRGLALNDVVVNRSGLSGMVELCVRVNGTFMYNQRSDGLIVATPTGSTAYAMSAGGPILHPRVSGIVMVPIAPHALSNRPIVLAQDFSIQIEITGGREVIVNFDMQSSTKLAIGDRIDVQLSNKSVTFLHPKGHSDYQALREKLHWNEYPSII
ncbi:MAG: NAD kinase [Polynucleobacter sp.]|jgi:NAD+ kinase|nr:NAD kinase [Polynucleobacter sp.]